MWKELSPAHIFLVAAAGLQATVRNQVKQALQPPEPRALEGKQPHTQAVSP